MSLRSIHVFLFLTLMAAVPLPEAIHAAAKSEAEVRAAVTTWVRAVTAQARPDALVSRVEPYQTNGRTTAYIVHLSGGGFCLCGADDVTLPVYFYNPSGTFDYENAEYRSMLDEIAIRDSVIRNAQARRDPSLARYQAALSERATQWRDLVAGLTTSAKRIISKPEAEPVMLTIDMTSQWHQGSPYNDNCPVLTPGSDEHCVVGCVATTMTQIMNYWKWPASGTGSNSVWYQYRSRSGWDSEPLAADPGIPSWWFGGTRLRWVPTSGGMLQMNGYWDASMVVVAKGFKKDNTSYINALTVLWNRLRRDSTNFSVNFGASTYDWSVLHDVHTDPVDDGDAELAKINYHAGVGVSMYYGISASGSDTGPLRNGFVNYFRYDGDAWYCARNEDLVVQEINWLRPVAFGGYSTTGGHEWVVCGYNKQTSPWQFLMNLGWGPGSTGWYLMDSVFSIGQDQIMRIAPTGVVRFVGDAVEFPDGSPSNPYNSIEQALSGAPGATMFVFKSGAVYTFSASELVIDRPLVLKGKEVTIRK